MPEVPKVAIITRTRNRPNLLRRAIRSVLDQKFEDWQHVIVNDGGDSKALDAVCAEFSDAYKDRLLILHEASTGMQNAANTGIRQSDSTYLVVHDDDDSWHPEFLLETTRFLEEAGPDSLYQGVISETLRVLEKENGKAGFEEIECKPYVPIKEVNIFRAGYENPFPPIAFLYRRTVHEEIGFFDPRWDMVADLDFNFRFLQRYEIGVVRRPLAFYHWRDSAQGGENANSVTQKKDLHGRYLNELKNHYTRKASSAREAALALGFQLSAFAVENQWMTTEIRERSNEAIVHLKALIRQVEALHEFNHEALWPKMTGDLIRKLDAIIEIVGNIEQLKAIVSDSEGRLQDTVHEASDGINQLLSVQARLIESLQAFNDQELWPKLSKDIIPRLDQLSTLVTESLNRANEQQTFTNNTLWPKLEDFSEIAQYTSKTLEAIWEKQGYLQEENQAIREEIKASREEIEALREQSKRQWQLGRLRLQWLPRKRQTLQEDNSD
jgi:hypothetical protein